MSQIGSDCPDLVTTVVSFGAGALHHGELLIGFDNHSGLLYRCPPDHL